MDMQVPRDILIFLTLVTAGLLSRAVTQVYRREVDSLARASRKCAPGARPKSNWNS